MVWGYGYCGACCNTPNTAVAGTLFGCTTSGIPGTVSISNGLTLLWSGSTSGSGIYTSASFHLAATTSLTITGTPTSSRNTATTVTRSIVVGSNIGVNISCAAASSFICTKVCPLAIADVLTLTSGGTCSGTAFPSDTLTWSPVVPAGFASAGTATPGWYGAASFTLLGNTYGYQFIVNSLGNLGLGALARTAGVSAFLATPLLTACVPFSCQTSCPAQGIGCTIHE